MDTEDVSTAVLFKLWPWLEANKNRLIGGGLVILVVAIIYSFMTWQHGQNEIAAGEAFTQLLFAQAGGTAPGQEADAFLAMASKYPGTEAAQRAQMQAAGVLFEAGNFPEAVVQFQKFADNHTGPLAATATLGLAASLEAQGKLDDAAAAYQKLTSSHVNPAAYLQAQFSLGRLAERNGKLAEAESYYETAAEPGRSGGTISEEAQGRAYEIKMKLSATQKPATNSFLK
ncbi:MAG TPA: tetratricopeptide repeat protein [Candidatus Angelobacter sp.]|nr:tetratricopeptide repeat protein [Candidatus Angelobacter sp.]